MRRYWINPIELLVFMVFASGFAYSGYRFYRETEVFSLTSSVPTTPDPSFSQSPPKSNTNRLPASVEKLKKPLIPLGY